MTKNLEIKTINIIEKIGDGYDSKIKLAEDPISKRKFVIKIFDENNFQKRAEKEFEIQKSLKHKNILKIHKIINKKNYSCLILDYCKYGDFLSLLQKKPFSENLSRYFSKKLLKTLIYMKTKNIYHKDIKLENILLSKNLNIKLADFGFATNFKKDESEISLGTKGYVSPEILLMKNHHPEKSDAFSFGVLLFIFVTGIPPFINASSEDPHYECFMNNPTTFWKFYKKTCGKEISQHFINLINHLFKFFPDSRYGFDEILTSEWMNLDCDKNSAIKEIKSIVSK